jgi:hypothetical protein
LQNISVTDILWNGIIVLKRLTIWKCLGAGIARDASAIINTRRLYFETYWRGAYSILLVAILLTIEGRQRSSDVIAVPLDVGWLSGDAGINSIVPKPGGASW